MIETISRLADPLGATVLDDAAKLVERRDWVQGQYEDSCGRVCTRQAIDLVTYVGEIDVDWDGRDAADYALRRYLALVPGEDVVTWNDEPGRTKDQVIGALRGAAKQLRAGVR